MAIIKYKNSSNQWKNISNAIYPVQAIWVSHNWNHSPSNYLGGTWSFYRNYISSGTVTGWDGYTGTVSATSSASGVTAYMRIWLDFSCGNGYYYTAGGSGGVNSNNVVSDNYLSSAPTWYVYRTQYEATMNVWIRTALD